VPHGVTGHITPWNYPAQLLACTVAPALAMGNASVLKPAEETSLTSVWIAALATESGLPDGVFNVVPKRQLSRIENCRLRTRTDPLAPSTASSYSKPGTHSR
jgi:acyl-CoA reductase-like NAD-dependent aldehyde dehydrogenase